MHQTKVTIIGAGVIGLAVACKLSESISDIIVLEKNDSFGRETSSRNSEVIHAGLYYEPGSLKATSCIRGRRLLYEFCSENNIPYNKIGKLVVASDDEEVKRIKSIYENALKCGVEDLRFLEEEGIKKLEPGVKAKLAIFSLESGIIDSHSLMDFFYRYAKQRSAMFSFSTEAIAIKKFSAGYKITVKEPSGEEFSFESRVVVNCAGLCSDKIAEMAGIAVDKYRYRLYYCKGQYFRIKSPAKFSINHLVYPPATKIDLGIHITPDMAGGLRLGPDANYVSNIDYSIDESQKTIFYESVKKFLPKLELDDLISDTAGIRPKLQAKDESFRDFVIQDEADKGFAGFVNLIGIESPGLTACMAIAEMVTGFLIKLDN